MTLGPGHDIVGDVHGYATRLEALLKTMGYAERDGVWMHPERTAIFVGDYVDRGPQNLRTCRIVMAMVEAGSAHAVMGNRDFNALCLATPDPNHPESFLRPHTTKNLQQAAATRAEMENSPKEAATVLDWLRRLPLWMESAHLVVCHAGWSRSAVAALDPFLDGGKALTDTGLIRAARKGDPLQQAREYLLNGPEAPLPYFDPDGHERVEARLAWWKAGADGLTWRDSVVGEDAVRAQLPTTPLPSGLLHSAGSPQPVFFGHYWMNAPLAPLSPTHACVDASVAKGGPLAAYRHSGESTLAASHFVYA
jgi:hypothetical protein